jgi:spiro-SPASM protein
VLKECAIRQGDDDVLFWKECFARTGSQHVCKIIAESPFLDPTIIQEMIDLHLRHLAEFTYSENLPPGFSCEIVSKELLASIPDMNETTLPLGQVVRSNINNFDVEIYYKEPDIRDKRLSFLSSDPRDARIMENMHRRRNGIVPFAEMRDCINSSPEMLYVGPSYVEIELTGRCDLKCLFCYRDTLGKVHDDMDPKLFKSILSQMNEFNFPYTICLGGSGEPLMHEHCYELLEEAHRFHLVEQIIVETNGILAGPNYRSYLTHDGKRTTTIVNINGIDPGTYEGIHGHDHYDTVVNNVLSLRDAADGRLYVQLMKINETEPFLDSFYDYWESQKVPVILQKQNTYLGRIPDRRYSDLSPLERVPCWHLQRDLYILSDGRVPFCKQDVDADHRKDSLLTSSLSEIWEKRRDSFINDYSKKYPASPDCSSCDEWYTFNA